jgi:hypothetical protein
LEIAEGDKRGREAVQEEEVTNLEMKDSNAKKTESCFAKRVSQLTWPSSQFNENQLIQIKMSPLSPQCRSKTIKNLYRQKIKQIIPNLQRT